VINAADGGVLRTRDDNTIASQIKRPIALGDEVKKGNAIAFGSSAVIALLKKAGFYG
jgi:hypothetical protein